MRTMNVQPRLVRAASIIFSLAVTALLIPIAAGAQSTTQPAPVVASSTTTIGTGLSQPQGVGVDASGNVFVASANSGSVVEFPAAGGSGVTIISGLSYNKGLTIDSLGNVYSTSYGGNVTRWPAGGGTASTFATGSTCPDFAAMGYYIGFYDLTADGSGNIYAYGGNKYLLEFNQSGACTERLTPTQIGALSPSAFASDSKGNIYFSAGSTIYSVPVGSTTPTALSIPSTAFASINAVTVDAAGNLYVTDANSIDEIPTQNGVLNTAAVTYLVPAGASFNIGISPSGVLYYGNFNANTVVKTVIGSLALGSSNVGTAGTPGSLTYTFNAAVTPTSFTYVSGSGATAQFATSTNGTTCGAGTAYPASTPNTISNCTLNVALTPATPGRILGGVLLQTASGTLATTYLSGSGTGPGLTIDPGTQTALGSFQTPTAVSVDGSGNVFVADSAQGTVTEFAAGSTTGTVVVSGLNSPQGLAVDGVGNLFIADTGNDQIVEVPIVNGALAASAKSVVASSLNTPLGLAIDQAGDLLIANSGGGNVLELPNQGGVLGSLPAFAVGSGFSKPVALAVDGTGTIFVGDGTLGNVYEISPVDAQSNVLAGYSQITGLAVDANDDLFLTQNGVSAVTKIALVTGAYAANATSTVGAGLKGPQGVAVDSAGNVYIADVLGGAAYQVLRTAGAINFGKVNIGSSSAAQSLILSNSGNASLTLNSPLYSSAGDTGDFSVTPSTSQPCGTSLDSGATCGLSAIFAPSATNSLTETLTFSSNAVNAASVTAVLSGIGANSAPTTLSLSASPTGTISFGQTLSITAAVAPQITSTLVPTGTVQFIVDGSNYGSPVALSSGGAASINVTGLSGGSHTVDASYSGDSNFATSASAAPLSVSIATASTTVAVSANINSNTAVATGTSATFTVTIKPAGLTPPPYPSGTVTFYANGSTTALGSAALTNGAGTFTTTALPNGQYNVTAVYSGDVDFSSSTSSGYAVYVSPPTFLFSNPPSALTVPAHGSNSTSFTVTNIAGYTGTVYFSCTGLPANSVCTFTPGAVDFTVTGGTQTVRLTVSTGSAATSFAGLLTLPALLGLVGLAVLSRRKRPQVWFGGLAMVLVGLAALSLSGCANNGAPATPTGSSTVVVHAQGSAANASSQPINQSFNLTVQVQ